MSTLIPTGRAGPIPDPSPAPAGGGVLGIQAEGIRYRYGRRLVLDEVDLAVPAGSIASLLGPNGAGKTTLLAIVGTLRRPEQGHIRVDGFDIAGQATLVRRRLGVVGHRNGHFPNLTCAENLALHAGFHGLARPEDAARASLDGVGLTAWANRPAASLSHGLARRLAIARALLHSPSVLLLDEPHSGLDPTSAATLDRLIVEFASGGGTVLMATHDLDRAQTLSHVLVRIEAGRITSSAPTEAADRSSARDRDAMGSRSPGASGRAATSPPPASVRVGAASPPIVKPALALARKDLAAEWRARRTVPSTMIFVLIITTLFGYAFPGTPEGLRDLAPGAMWVALIVGAMPGVSRQIYADEESGALDAIRTCPIDPAAIFVGPWLSAWTLGVATALVLVPAQVAFFQVEPVRIPALLGIAALGLAGWAAAGVLTSAMAISARARELLLPVVLLPFVLPLVLAAVTATRALLGDPTAPLGPSLVVVGAYDVVFLVAGFLAMPFVLDA